MFTRFLCSLCVVALVLSASSLQARAATVTQISSTLFVVQLPANVAGWQSTGLNVCADSRWSVFATGLANYENDVITPERIQLRWHGPGGNLDRIPAGGTPPLVPGAPQFTLVGEVGTTPFYVGEGGQFSGSAGDINEHPIGDGILSFAFNDSYYPDNDGFFLIYLTYLSGSCAPVAVESAALPAVTRLGPGVPNPTQSRADFAFETPERASYTISVVDVSGRLVREIHRGVFEPGTHTVHWDGTGSSGRVVAAGTYFCVVTGAGKEVARKVIVVP